MCCFTLADPHKDLQIGAGGVYSTWLSHSKAKLNAVAMKPSKHILHISKTHNALVFENALYKVEGAVISPLPFSSNHNYTCVCITFQVEGEHDQFFFTNSQEGEILSTNFRGVSASNKEIRIWGVKNNEKSYLSIPHKTKRTEWTMLLVEWSNINDNRGSYILNNKKELGAFTCQDVGFIFSGTVSIGGKIGGTHLLKCATSALEIYVGNKTREDCVPDKLKHLIISSQLIESKLENAEPPEKKKNTANQ